MGLGHFVYTGNQIGETYSKFYAGRVAVGATASQLPSIPCGRVNFKADPNNAGDVFIGGADVTTGIGWQLDAAEETGWIPVNNLDAFYCIGSDGSQELSYMIVYD